MANYILHTIHIVTYISITRICIFLVPPPIVNISDPDTQTVGQSLTLQCNVTIGSTTISSAVDIIWSDGNGELNRTTDVTSRTVGSDSVYTDSFTISQLSTTDEGRVIQCEVVINVSPSVMASDSITLDVTGEYSVCVFMFVNSLLLYTQFPLLQSPYHHLVPYKELWWVVLELSIVQ